MPRDYKVHLQDILEAASRIRRYTSSFRDFAADQMVMDAVVRNLEVIGEAAKAVPAAIRQRHPGVEWKKISGLRDILIHEYFGINAEIVRDIVENKLPRLVEDVENILKEAP